MNKKRTLTGVSGFALGTALMGHAVTAQEQVSQDTDTHMVLDTIIVTAQKREENILDVPVSISVVKGDQLANRNITEVGDLQRLAPNLVFTAANSARTTNFAIRGIGTFTFSNAIEGSVGVVVDGVVMGRVGGGIFDLADIERVEVLRGPQGTLFGKNASAGVISIVSKKPSDELEMGASASWSGPLDEKQFSGYVSGPVTDTVGFRLVGYHNSRDGQITDVISGQKYNDRKEWGFRGKLEIDLTEDSSLLLIGDYSKKQNDCCTWTLRQLSPGGLGSGLFRSGVNIIGNFQTSLGIVPGEGNKSTALSGSLASVGEIWGGSGHYQHNFDGFSLTSITAYREWSQADNNDADLTTFNLLDDNFGDSRQKQFTQEIRLSSHTDHPLQWTIGGFYFDQSVANTSAQNGTFGLDLLGSTSPGTILGKDIAVFADTKNYALFGDVTYAVADNLRLLAGARYQHEKLDAVYLRTNSNPLSPFILGPTFSPLDDTLGVKDDGLSWRIGVQYDMNSTSMAYATVTRGYKGPGINTFAGTIELKKVDPEISTSYEVGVKSAFADGRVFMSAAAYYTEFDGFQTESLVATNSGLTATDLINAGKLETYGVELEAIVSPVEGLNITAGASLTKATFAEDFLTDCYTFQTAENGCVNGFQNLKGESLQGAPDFTFNISSLYKFPLTDDGFDGFVSASYSHRSSVVSSRDLDPNTKIDGYGLFDASMGVASSDDRWKLSIFGRNLFKQEVVEVIFNTPLDTGGYSQFITPSAERVIGVKLDVNF